MVQRLTVLLLFAAFLPLAPAQQPQPPEPAAEFDADAIVQEINAFYAEYWKAWNDRNSEGVAAGLAPDFVGHLYVASKGVVQFDKDTEVEAIRRFFEAVRGRDAAWSRSLLAVIPRSSTEAVAAVRNDFSLVEGGGEIDLTLEVLRKGPDGRWALVRKWSEKVPF